MARGRPAADAKAWEIFIHLRLRVGEDDDLIAFLGKLPPGRRATAIKTALRTGGMTIHISDDSISDDEMLDAVDDFLK